MEICFLFLSVILFVFYAQAQQKKSVYYFNPSWSPDGKQIVTGKEKLLIGG